MNTIKKIGIFFSTLIFRGKWSNENGMSVYFPYNDDIARSIASLFIKKNGGTIDRLKLNKLLYFLETTALKEFECSIIGGKYVSFEFGPAISPVADSLKYNSWRNIKCEDITVTLLGEVDDSCLSEWIKELVDRIYNEFGHMGTWDISRYSHERENCPEWIPTKRGDVNDITIKDIVGEATSDLEDLARDLHVFNKIH